MQWNWYRGKTTAKEMKSGATLSENEQNVEACEFGNFRTLLFENEQNFEACEELRIWKFVSIKMKFTEFRKATKILKCTTFQLYASTVPLRSTLERKFHR
jgi:hypothetical protein